MILQVSPSPPPKKRTPEVKKRSRSWRCCCCLTPRSTVQSLARKEGKSIDQKKWWRVGSHVRVFFVAVVLNAYLIFFNYCFCGLYKDAYIKVELLMICIQTHMIYSRHMKPQGFVGSAYVFLCSLILTSCREHLAPKISSSTVKVCPT